MTERREAGCAWTVAGGDPVTQPAPPPPGRLPVLRCRRCARAVSEEERELYSGLCFWCGFVDPQG